MNRKNSPESQLLRRKLNEAFKALRKHGLLARQNYLCCHGCAGTQMAIDAEKLVGEGTTVAGGVFYHKQCGDRLREGRSFYVYFGTIESDKLGIIGTLTDEAIGRLVVEEFEKARIRVVWSGDFREAILVEPGEPEPKTAWERIAAHG